MKDDDKVLPFAQPAPTDVQRISGLMTTYTKELTAKFARAGGQVDPVAMLGILQIQGIQLEEFMALVFSGEPITAAGFNARMETRIRAEIGKIRNMLLLARAQEVPKPP